jgi:hypothetical protein
MLGGLMTEGGTMARGPATKQRARRRVLAVALAAVAVAWIVIEPLPKGAVLLELTSAHGVDVGDLPAILLLLAAARLTV